MKIKEVEQRTGIGRSNIRYYEREGLLRPARVNDSNYRDYTEDDVRQLNRIKVLRMMGVAPADIKLLATENISLEEVMKKRLEQLEAEVQEAKNLQKVCENVLDNKLDFYSLNEDVFSGNPEEWQDRLREILEHDMVNEVITRKQVNKHLMLSLIYGYLLNALVTFLTGDFFLTYERTLDPATIENSVIPYRAFPVISMATYIMSVIVVFSIVILYISASVKVHIAIFHISAIITTPFIIEFTRIYTDARHAEIAGVKLLGEFSGVQLAVFWIMIVSYVMILYLINLIWKRLLVKRRNIIPVALIFTVIYTYMAFIQTGEWKIPLVGFLVMTLFIGISWAGAINDREEYNRYYAVIVAAKMMNVMGCVLINLGRGSHGGRTGYKG